MDYGLVASTDPEWLQGVFYNLTGLLDRVGLQTNVGNTVGMVCCYFQAAGTQSEAADERQMTGEGITYWERQRVGVKCSDCGEEIAVGLMAVHQHV